MTNKGTRTADPATMLAVLWGILFGDTFQEQAWIKRLIFNPE